MDEAGLSSRIKEDNDFFKRLVDRIPVHVYFDQETKDEIRGEVGTDDEGNKPKKKKRNARRDERRGKLVDPMEGKTVTQLQDELDNKTTADPEGMRVKSKKKKTKKSDKGRSETLKEVPSKEELRERLLRRIEELKGKRGHRSPEEWIEQKKLKRKASKLKQKMRAKKEKLNPVKGDNSRNVLPNGEITSPVNPVYNKEGKIVFSKFDFSDTGEKTKTPMADLTGKDYKKILDNLEKRKEKVKKLQETNVLAARELQKKSAWQMAIGKAEGVKIKDDPELLKKALKRKEKRKEKSAKSWKFREEKTEQKKKERQEKRQKNIDSRKQTKQKNKLKKAVKKGRIIPGF
ncbi:surfeit locus protein 6 homolog [Liolophura sinensis]|uniref:surfeit locus protein 6 homolog n=1 Tax=Liolophura sinensis TaxID=3198878 RepID=UPI0031596A48